MKKIVFFLLATFFTLTLFANVSSKPVKKYPTNHITKLQNQKKKNSVLHKMQSLCRVTCTITATGPNGEVVSWSATAGGLFTSCETAGEYACNRARLNAAIDVWGN